MKEINFEVNNIEQIDLSLGMGIKKIYPPIDNLEVIPTKEEQIFTHENSYGYDEVKVKPIPDEYVIPEGMLPITENATYDVRRYARVSASVHPAPNLQDKSISIVENGTQIITADDGYDGLNQVNVTVNAIEDLTNEINIYDTELTTQEVTIENIREVLKNKTVGSGGITIPTTVNEFKASYDNIFNGFMQYLDNLPNTYDKYTTEPITIYVPESGYNYYVIRKRAENTYSIILLNEPYYVCYQNSTAFWFETLSLGINTQCKPYTENATIGVSLYQQFLTPYLSQNYTSFDACIEALKNPSTTYTKGSYGGWTSVVDGDYMVSATNLPCIYSLDEIGFSRRISSNETIKVIGG